MQNYIDLTKVSPKDIYRLSPSFSGKNPTGDSLSFTNYYMDVNGKPFYGISGEVHYSRLSEKRWEDALIKMKAAGINIISTYIFWIHHEEEEGVFDFSGRRNIRSFVKLCRKLGLYIIVRIGPFDHGEVRNGGLPDWIYGKPFEARSLDEGFLDSARRLYRRLAEEFNGLYYKDGGPIIAAQIDNEYMHSAAPWENTRGVSDEWVPGGNQGNSYMLKLRDIAIDEGICVPFYTCTGWGGAATPDDLMPLWGGYAFRPWIFYSHKGEHPATEEYIYRDNHNNAVPATYNFEPFYKPESRPYLCCEMGGGMTCCYYYRFQLPFESVDAMANIKIGSGCNMLGYYMFHGGTNPKGLKAEFLNEGQVPKLSYDYQAALGEYGQVRDSYRRLKALHLFIKSCEYDLCSSKTVLPEGSQDIDPHDTGILRYSVRITATGSGFVFLNNYQDHIETRDKKDESITLQLPDESIVIDGINLAAGENCILPFRLPVGGVILHYALAQPLTLIKADGNTYAFFFAPEGMTPRYAFYADTVIDNAGAGCTVFENGIVEVDCSFGLPMFSASQGDNTVYFITLTRRESLHFNLVEQNGRQAAVFTDGTLLPGFDGSDSLRIQHDRETVSLAVFPKGAINLQGFAPVGLSGIFTQYKLSAEPVIITPTLRQVGATRYVADIPKWDKSKAKEILLQVHYEGDIGQAFIDGEMVADNFYNGAVWEIGLQEIENRLTGHPLTLYITPIKKGANVNVESVMAGRMEDTKQLIGKIDRVTAKAVYEWIL